MLAAVSTLASTVVDDLDLTTLARGRGPLLEAGPVSVEVDALEHAPGSVVRFSAAGDTLRGELRVNELTARLSVRLATSRLDVVLSAERFAVDVPLDVEPDGGRFALRLATPAFHLTEPRLTLSNPDHPELAETFSLGGDLMRAVEGLVARTALRAGTTQLDALFARLTEPLVHEVGGVEVRAELAALRAGVSDGGIDLALSGHVVARCAGGPEADPGVLRTAGHESFRPTGDGLGLAVQDDLLNAVLHEAWRCAGFEVQLDQRLVDAQRGEVTLVAGMLGGLSERLDVDPETPLALRLEAPLPPVATPVSGSLGLGLGDLRLHFVDPGGRSLVSARMSLLLAASARQAETGGVAVGLAVHRATLDVDAADLAAKRLAEGPLDPWVDMLAGVANGFLATSLRPIELPALRGLDVVDVRVGDAGTGGAWLVMAGGLR